MKKSFFPILAVVLAFSLSAFTNKQPAKAPLTQKWFQYDAYPSDDPSDVNDPASYSLVGGTGSMQPGCDNAQVHVCGILANDNGSGKPVISSITQTLKRN